MQLMKLFRVEKDNRHILHLVEHQEKIFNSTFTKAWFKSKNNFYEIQVAFAQPPISQINRRRNDAREPTLR